MYRPFYRGCSTNINLKFSIRTETFAYRGCSTNINLKFSIRSETFACARVGGHLSDSMAPSTSGSTLSGSPAQGGSPSRSVASVHARCAHTSYDSEACSMVVVCVDSECPQHNNNVRLRTLDQPFEVNRGPRTIVRVLELPPTGLGPRSKADRPTPPNGCVPYESTRAAAPD